MSMNLNKLVIIIMISTLGFIACENSTRSQVGKAKDSKATFKRDVISKAGRQTKQSQFVALNMNLLNQSHSVFLQVWKKVFTNENGITPISDDKRSIFNESLKSMRQLLTDDGHSRRSKSEKKLRNNCTHEQLTFGVDEIKNKNLRFLMYTIDCNNKLVARQAEFVMTAENQLTWTFNPQYFREGVGLRLATLGASKLIQCQIGFENSGLLKSMLCQNLGQDEGDGKHYEFEKFKFDTTNKDNEFDGVLKKYKNISEIDKDFRTSAQWGETGNIQLRILVPEKVKSKPDISTQDIIDSGKRDSNDDIKPPETVGGNEKGGETAADVISPGANNADIKNDDMSDNSKHAFGQDLQGQPARNQKKQEDSEPEVIKPAVQDGQDRQADQDDQGRQDKLQLQRPSQAHEQGQGQE